MKEKVNLEDTDGITILKDKGYNIKIEIDTKKKKYSGCYKIIKSR